MLYEDCKKFVKGLVPLNCTKKYNELDIRLKLYEYIKNIEKIQRWNRLLGFTDDKYKIIYSTRNSRSQKWEKEERRIENDRSCK